MGRVDTALLSIRRARSFEKSMVLVRLFAGRRRNAQRTIVIRRTFLPLLVIVAKRVDLSAAHPRGLCGDDSIDSFTVAFAHSGGRDRRGYCRWY